MRKYFWCFGICGAVLLGAVVATANHAARYPGSLIGRVLHGASHVATNLNPITGFGAVLKEMKRQDERAAGDVVGVPDDPVAECDEREVRCLGVTGAIVISEEDPAPVTTMSWQEPGFRGSECPPSDVCRAPALMPPCEGEECEQLPMPVAEECQTAKCSVWECLACPMQSLAKLVCGQQDEEEGPAAREMGEEAQEPAAEGTECREDPHHCHDMVCPYTGRSCPRSCAPSYDEPKKEEAEQLPMPAEESEAAGEEEQGEDDDAMIEEAVRQIEWLRYGEKFPGVDTMEMRPSDRQLYDYGPGAL